ncbi:MAG: hypothetical protein ACLR6O_06055 [Eubacterium sp.]
MPSSMLAMIKYIKAENDYEQLITVNSGNIKESEEGSSVIIWAIFKS